MEYAIIGGTGLENIPGMKFRQVPTPYGDASVGEGEGILFLSRHGVDHSVPPHLINHKANVWALRELGVKYVLASNAVGSCTHLIKPGTLVVINDFIDMTGYGPHTFSSVGSVTHAAMEEAYSRRLSDILERQAIEKGLPYSGRAVYACMPGPRFETAAEIRMLGLLGAGVVGMTAAPECVLCRELGIEYGAYGIVSNYATGLSEPVDGRSIDELLSVFKMRIINVYMEIAQELSGI